MGMGVNLPEEFRELEPFVPYWAVNTSQERIARRSEASMEAMKLFYDAMLLRGEEILSYIERSPLDQLPPESELLFKLMLSLAHVAMAVEIHGQPRAPNSPYPNGLRITQGATPLG
jgi:hypothetical protein